MSELSESELVHWHEAQLCKEKADRRRLNANIIFAVGIVCAVAAILIGQDAGKPFMMCMVASTGLCFVGWTQVASHKRFILLGEEALQKHRDLLEALQKEQS